MIRGRVNERLDATIPVEIIANGHRPVVEAVVDTGFNGFLTLPSDLVSKLKLPFESYGHACTMGGRDRASAGDTQRECDVGPHKTGHRCSSN